MDKEKIIAFLEGRLAVSEKNAIQNKIKSDAKFAQEVAGIKSDWEIQLMAGRALVKTKMNDWETNVETAKTDTFFDSKKNWENALQQEGDFLAELNQTPEQSSSSIPTEAKVIPLWRKFVKPLGIAAGFLLLLTVGAQQWSATTLSDEALLSTFYNDNLGLDRSKGADGDNNIINLEKAIQSKQYPEAIQQAEQILATSKDETIQIKTNYLLAQTYKQQGNYPNAIQYFEIVENKAIGAAKKTAQINIILLQILAGEEEQALIKLKAIRTNEADNLGTEDLKLLNDLEAKLTHPLRSWVK